MSAMYRKIQQDHCAEESVPVEASRGFHRVCGFEMRISKKLRDAWHYLGVYKAAVVLVLCVASVTFPPSIICTHIMGLSPQQMRFCEKNPAKMEAITNGYHLGLEECKYQFRKRRWNCTSLGSKHTFSSHAVPGTKESAFTHAIISAGIAHSVTLDCTKGNFSECGCIPPESPDDVSSSVWGARGCNVNIERGIKIANDFLNGQDVGQSDIALMNKHNNGLGGEVLRNSLDLQCKCHGPSGSCSMKTCWTWVPLFRQVGKKLKKMYLDRKTNVQVQAVTKRSTSGKVPVSLVLKKNKNVKPEELGTMVWLRSSPSYCDKMESLGVVGTTGRECNKEYGSQREDSCEVLCCGRGYNVRETVRVSQCLCKFYWCCEVRCKSCSRKEMIYNCQ